MKWTLGAAESSKLVYYIVKLIGLAPLTLKNNRFHPPTLPGLLYPVAMAVTHLLLMITAIVFRELQIIQQNYSQSAKIEVLIKYVACLPTTFSTLTIFILSRRKIMNLLNELCDMSHKFTALGIEEDPGKFLNNVIVTTVMANAITITMGVLLTMFEPNWHIFQSIAYSIGSWFSVNVLLIFVHVLCCIKRRFELVNERLSNLLVQSHEVGSSSNSQASATSGGPREGNETVDEGLTQHQRIMRKIEGLRLELSSMLDQTADISGITVLFNSLQFFCVIVLSSEFIRSAVQSVTLQPCNLELFGSVIVGRICSPLLRMIIAIFQISIIVYTSATTSQEGNLTRAVLNDTFNDFSPAKLEELEDEFFMFSIQLARKKVAVSAFGLFNLDYSYVYKMFGGVVSYLIIMIQFETDSWKAHISELLQAYNCDRPD